MVSCFAGLDIVQKCGTVQQQHSSFRLRSRALWITEHGLIKGLLLSGGRRLENIKVWLVILWALLSNSVSVDFHCCCWNAAQKRSPSHLRGLPRVLDRRERHQVCLSRWGVHQVARRSTAAVRVATVTSHRPQRLHGEFVLLARQRIHGLRSLYAIWKLTRRHEVFWR